MSLKIELMQRIDLGIQGEHNAREILIDCNAWKEQFPNGSISLYHQRHGDDAMSVTGAQYSTETGMLTWPVTEYDTYYGGDGLAEIRLTDGTVTKKKKRLITLTRPAVVDENGDSIGSNWQAYIDEVERQKALLSSNAEAWAYGTRHGVPVSSADEAYHKNSKWYADNISSVAEGYLDDINAAAQHAQEMIPEDLTFYATVASVTQRLAAFGYVDGTTLVLDEPESES